MIEFKNLATLVVALICLGACASAPSKSTGNASACAVLKDPCVENDVIVIVNPKEDAFRVLKFAADSRARHEEYFLLGPQKRFAVVEDTGFQQNHPFKALNDDIDKIVYPSKIVGFREQQMPMYMSVHWFMHSIDHSQVGSDPKRYSIMEFPLWIRDVAYSIQLSPQQQQAARADVASANMNGLVPLELFFSLDLRQLRSDKDLIAWTKQLKAKGDDNLDLVKNDKALSKTNMKYVHQRLKNQAVAFRDFMVNLSGDEKVFYYIAPHVYEDGSMDQWLATQTDYPTVPKTVAALESRWYEWTSREL